jgi:hypothetical protein
MQQGKQGYKMKEIALAYYFLKYENNKTIGY